MTVPHPPRRPVRPPWRRLALCALVLGGLLVLAGAWASTSLKDMLDLKRLVVALQSSGQSVGPALAVLGLAGALVLAVPLTFLTVVGLVAFGPVKGCMVVVAGAVLSAAITFTLGKSLGHQLVIRLGGPGINTISQSLAGHGLWAVAAIRLIPIAPFAIVNLVAGATHIGLRDMLAGTVLGMAPGTLMMAFFIDQILDAMARPEPTIRPMLVTMALLIGTGLLLARKWFKAMARRPAAGDTKQEL